MSDFLVQHSLRLVLKQQQRHKSPRTRIPKNFHIFRVHRHKNDIERTDECDENSTRTTRRTKGRTLSRFVRQSIRSFFCPELFFRWFLSWYFFFKLKTKHSFATSKQKVSFKKMLYAKTTTTWWWWRRRDNDPFSSWLEVDRVCFTWQTFHSTQCLFRVFASLYTQDTMSFTLMLLRGKTFVSWVVIANFTWTAWKSSEQRHLQDFSGLLCQFDLQSLLSLSLSPNGFRRIPRIQWCTFSGHVSWKRHWIIDYTKNK